MNKDRIIALIVALPLALFYLAILIWLAIAVLFASHVFIDLWLS